MTLSSQFIAIRFKVCDIILLQCFAFFQVFFCFFFVCRVICIVFVVRFLNLYVILICERSNSVLRFRKKFFLISCRYVVTDHLFVGQYASSKRFCEWSTFVFFPLLLPHSRNNRALLFPPHAQLSLFIR